MIRCTALTLFALMLFQAGCQPTPETTVADLSKNRDSEHDEAPPQAPLEEGFVLIKDDSNNDWQKEYKDKFRDAPMVATYQISEKLLTPQTTQDPLDRLRDVFSQLKSSDPSGIHSAHRRLAVIGKANPAVAAELATIMWDPQVNETSQYWALKTLVELGPSAKAVMPDLVKMMQHEDRYFRLRGALGVLLAEGDPVKPVAELKALASHNYDSMIRGEAFLALGQAGPIAEDAIPFLRQVIEDPSNGQDREYATLALGGMEDKAKSSVPLLIELLKEKNDDLRKAATRALSQLVPTCPEAASPLIQLMKQSGHESHSVAEALIAGGPRIVPDLVELLKSDNAAAQENAIHTLTYMGEDAAPSVIDLVAAISKLPDFRVKIVDALANIGPVAVPHLATLLSQDDPANIDIIWDICNKIGEVGEPAKEAVPALISIMVNSEDERNRLAATNALIAIGPGGAKSTPSLVNLVNEETKEADMNAIRVLAAIGPGAKKAVQSLTKVIQQHLPQDDYRSQEKAIAAACALCEIGIADEETISLVIETLSRSGMPHSFLALGLLGPEAAQTLPQLRRSFSTEYFEIRIEAALAVSRIDESATDSVPVLVQSLTDPQGKLLDDFDGRYLEAEVKCAIRALTEMGEQAQDALVPLRELLDHETEVSALAALAIYRINSGDPQALVSLVLTLESTDSFGPNAAIEALGEIGPDARVALPKLRTIAVSSFSYYERDLARASIRAIESAE